MKVEKKESKKSEIELVVELSVDEFKPYITKGVHNHVAIISNDEAFVSATMSVFYRMLDETTTISVFSSHSDTFVSLS